MNQKDKARRFADLHTKASPLILYNAWDAGSAKAIAQAGARAIATSSWALAHALGYEDGEQIPRTLVEEIVGGIVETAPIPVTVDFEGGYADDDDQLTRNVDRLLHLGIVGINLGGQVSRADDPLKVERQAERIATVRRAATRKGIDLFINASTDLFLGSGEHQAKTVDEAIDRAHVYAAAGASGFFVPGLTQDGQLERICASIPLPISVMRMEGIASNDHLARLGVARISYGKIPYSRAIEAIRTEAARALFRDGRVEAD